LLTVARATLGTLYVILYVIGITYRRRGLRPTGDNLQEPLGDNLQEPESL